MDEKEMMDPAIIQGLFEQGVRKRGYVSSTHFFIRDAHSSSWESKPA